MRIQVHVVYCGTNFVLIIILKYPQNVLISQIFNNIEIHLFAFKIQTRKSWKFAKYVQDLTERHLFCNLLMYRRPTY